LEDTILKRVDRVIAVSSELEKSLQLAGVPHQRLTHISNGIDVSRFENVSAAEDLEKLKAGRLAVGLVGQLIERKGHRQVLESVPEILKHLPQTLFVIVGDGQLRGSLEGLCHKLRISASVVFVGARDDMPQVYAALDCMVLASSAEGTPMVVLEAMAAKVSVVCSNLGGTRDLVLNEQTGLTFEPGNQSQLQQCLIRALGGAQLRLSLGERANALVRDRYSMAGVANLYRNEYRKAMNRGSMNLSSPKESGAVV